LQARADFGDRDRPAEAIALHRVNAGGAQEQLLVGGLHAFGGYLHAETAAQADDGMHDRCGIGGSFDRSHETAVDFQLVEWETAQIEQAGIAGAEIVQRETHAQGFETHHRSFRGVDIAEQHALGQLQLKPGWIEARFVQDALDNFDEIDAPELQRRNVDGNGQSWPRFAIDAGPAQHPISEIDDQSTVFGDRNEFSRRYLPAGWVRPPAERLNSDDRLAAFVHNGLVHKLQAVIIDCLAQVSLKQLTAGKVRIHRRVIDARAITALILGAVKRISA
jgi:hypothetical protein